MSLLDDSSRPCESRPWTDTASVHILGYGMPVELVRELTEIDASVSKQFQATGSTNANLIRRRVVVGIWAHLLPPHSRPIQEGVPVFLGKKGWNDISFHVTSLVMSAKYGCCPRKGNLRTQSILPVGYRLYQMLLLSRPGKGGKKYENNRCQCAY